MGEGLLPELGCGGRAGKGASADRRPRCRCLVTEALWTPSPAMPRLLGPFDTGCRRWGAASGGLMGREAVGVSRADLSARHFAHENASQADKHATFYVFGEKT